MIEKVIIAGAGGQGIMLLGRVLAEAAMRENKFVTWIPCYGAEVRGGTAHCRVVISDREIGSPYFDKADALIIMNQLSLDKFKHCIKNKGSLIVNTSLARCPAKKSARILRYPFTDIAIKMGNIKVANMLALGCYIANKKTASLENVFATIKAMAPVDKKGLIEINQQALLKGAQLNGKS